MNSTLKNSYLHSGTILGMKNNNINVELSNINGNSVYYHEHGKEAKLIYSDTDIDECINKFIIECKITNCDYVNLSSGPYLYAYISKQENILHLNNNCKEILYKDDIIELKIYYDNYIIFKRLNLFCMECYEPVFYKL
ncbi:unknown similar to AMEV034 [Mythimna separata entomopoxvirus 'L']|uniref:Uncharacterized protein n=1 Tax=Mythimna separata entomopoxvirus 'L' TaxID=1293572 RepID=A0A916P1P1_9POXV|nr:unknown similar to AMEV034 [Mythimna separata entomopoxvirus 'L']CCU56260.1 unknown similar to AMEV034 [Mythimna separata entomopoxvirus 'L']